jgi:Mg-chelatase subunit ChlI
MTCRKSVFPFTAIVGQEKMKKALILNAVNPHLGGVLIRGEKGTAKSTAARALANLLPEMDVVKDCPFNCSTDKINEMCPSCFARYESGEKLPLLRRKVRVVELPLGATEDRVIGSIDMEKAIKKGEKHFDPGILADVNRGILYVDEINLLDDHIVDVLLDAAAMGVNYIEREGVSFSHPARFILVGTMNPEEGELRPQLLDRFGMCIEVEGISDPALRVQVMQRFMAYEKDHHEFEHMWDDEERKLAETITVAEKLLPEVRYDHSILDIIADVAITMAVDGHRADIFILKVSCTIAAYHGRTDVTPEDVQEAAELVLNHRMRRKPFEEQGIDQNKLSEAIENSKKKLEMTSPNRAAAQRAM